MQQKLSELAPFSMGNTREWSERCEEGCKNFALQRNGKGVVSILSTIVARCGRRHLPSFSTDNARLQKILFKKMAMDNWSSVVLREERKQEVVLKFSNYRELQHSLKQFLSDTFST